MSQQVCDAGVSCIIVYLQEVMEWVFVLLNVHAATRRWYECAAKTTLKRMFNESVWIDLFMDTSSVMESREDVASSYKRMGGCFNMARAMATRCFSPPKTKQKEKNDKDMKSVNTLFWTST